MAIPHQIPPENISFIYSEAIKTEALSCNFSHVTLGKLGRHAVCYVQGDAHEGMVNFLGVINIVFSYVWPSFLTCAPDITLSDGSVKKDNSVVSVVLLCMFPLIILTNHLMKNDVRHILNKFSMSKTQCILMNTGNVSCLFM